MNNFYKRERYNGLFTYNELQLSSIKTNPCENLGVLFRMEGGNGLEKKKLKGSILWQETELLVTFCFPLYKLKVL